MPPTTAGRAGISWRATSRIVRKAGCRAPPARVAKADGKFRRSSPGNGAKAFSSGPPLGFGGDARQENAPNQEFRPRKRLSRPKEAVAKMQLTPQMKAKRAN